MQTPTLVLVAEREKERRAFVPEPYWVVKVDLEAGGQTFPALHKEERFSDEERATSIFEKIASPGKVTAVKQTSRKVPQADSVQHHQLHQRRHVARFQRGRRHADR